MVEFTKELFSTKVSNTCRLCPASKRCLHLLPILYHSFTGFIFLVFFIFSCTNKPAVYLSNNSNKNSILFPSLVKGCEG